MTRVEENLRATKEDAAKLVVGACRSLAESREWSDFDLAESLQDVWRLSEREDCCYDRPSVGLNYALWYHARRTQDMLRLALRSWEARPPGEILDLGAGTGATLWALAFAIRAGLPIDRVRVVSLDGSPPMLHAAEHMWGWLGAQPEMASAVDRIEVEFSCRSWTQPGVSLESPDVIAGYLFDDSDQGRLKEVVEAFHRVAEHYAAPRVHVISSNAKKNLLAQVAAHLCERDWANVNEPRLAEIWTGSVADLRTLRRSVLSGIETPLRWDSSAPVFSHSRERPFAVTLRHEAPSEKLDLRTGGAFVLDERQSAASAPEDRMTVVVGPAGSGKSRVAIERLARLFEEDSAKRLNVLFTTFNVQLIDQLATWFDERNGSYLERTSSGRGDIRYADPAVPRQRKLRFLNWDKVPSRLFKARASDLSTPPFESVLQRRVDQLQRENGKDFSDAAKRNLTPTFLQAELRRTIWGLGIEDLASYSELRRRGRQRQLPTQHRNSVWEVLMGEGHPILFDHIRMRARQRSTNETFTHVLIDECQDFTPADFELSGALVEDTRGVWAFGDRVQALQLGPAYRRPGVLAGTNGQGRRWKRFDLPASYRLPLRVAEAISPLADKIIERDRPLYDEADGPVDAIGLEAVTSAVLGIRPILIAGSKSDVPKQVGQVLASYRKLFDLAEPANRLVTLAEGDPELKVKSLQDVAPEGLIVRQESMRAIKGLERSAVIWSTGSFLNADESLDEWIYTILSRTTGILVILLSDRMNADAAHALRQLRQDRLLPWTPQAAERLRQLHAQTEDGHDGS
jgi:DNA helicase II / ATP-dependent DNA helicase PcrA